MAQIRSKELIGSSGAVVARVGGSAWTKTSPGGVQGWGGDLYPLGDDLLTIDAGAYTLRLPDGSEGEILISNLRISSSVGRGARSSATFRGNGAPPASLFR
jgi:hypothetical protein